MKLLSVTVVAAGLWLYFGVNINAIISTAGTSNPKREYSYGRLELLQAKHHTIEKMIAIIMIRVPTPTPKTFEVD